MPGSLSLPFSTLLASQGDPAYTTLLPRDQLRQVLESTLGGRLQDVLVGKQQVVATCGSGMSAAIIWLALHELGAKSAIYDESWMGYASREDSKIVKD